MSLESITVAVPSFLRFGYLATCLAQLRTHLPECRICVADDSGLPPHVPTGVKLISLPFDSGLTVKRNAIVAATETPYLLLYCDDFATDERTRAGVEKLASILDSFPDVDVASGRVDNRPYEGYLEYVPGSHIREHRVANISEAPYTPVDLTVNYFLARVSRLIPWDETIVPIGGEHGDWFLAMKEAGRKTVWVPGVNVDTLRLGSGPEVQDPRYWRLRARAYLAGHTVFKKKRNIQYYIDWEGNKS